MFEVLLSEASLPANSSGIVVTGVSLLIALAWLWYLYR